MDVQTFGINCSAFLDLKKNFCGLTDRVSDGRDFFDGYLLHVVGSVWLRDDRKCSVAVVGLDL